MATSMGVTGLKEENAVIVTTRYRRPSRKVSSVASEKGSAQENLTRAFFTFTQAANSLEQSYGQLQAEVSRLHQELERANAEVDRSLEENGRVREYLAKVLDRLPCGVVTTNGEGRIQIVNPEARKLLGANDGPREVPGLRGANAAAMPASLVQLFNENETNPVKSEFELPVKTRDGDRIIGVLRESLSSANENSREAIWILRDLTEQKRIASEREASRRAEALAEVATVLAHEIRNPLGSMELFTGLLADASAHLPETRQWIIHLRAGLRVLAATVNNVLYHARPVLQLVPADLGRLVTEAMDFLQPMAKQRGQTIKIENRVGIG